MQSDSLRAVYDSLSALGRQPYYFSANSRWWIIAVIVLAFLIAWDQFWLFPRRCHEIQKSRAHHRQEHREAKRRRTHI